MNSTSISSAPTPLTIEAANSFAPAFIAAFNARFGKEPRNPKAMHRPLADYENLDGVMCRKEMRKLSQTLCRTALKCKNAAVMIVDALNYET